MGERNVTPGLKLALLALRMEEEDCEPGMQAALLRLEITKKQIATTLSWKPQKDHSPASTCHSDPTWISKFCILNNKLHCLTH